jgi:tetratricopeptide (TPR) repeat protein
VTSTVTLADDDKALNISKGMTEYQHFATYPFIDKAMRDEKNGQYKEAFTELEHALKKAPNNHELLKYGIELSIKMDNYQLMESWLEKLPLAQRNALSVHLKLTQLNHPKLLTYFELHQLLEGLSLHDQELGYQTLFYANLHHYGAKKTLAWSQSIPFNLKVKSAIAPEAQLAFSQKDYVGTIDALAHLAQVDKLSGDDRYILALSYLKLGQIKPALALANTDPNSHTSNRILTEYAFHLLGQKDYVKAMAVFSELEKNKGLNAEASVAYQDLKKLTTEQIAQKAALEYTPCTQEVVEALPNKHQARILLAGCDPTTHSAQWLNLAEASNAINLLEKTSFSNQRLAKKRINILVNSYVKTNNWKAITRLSKQLHQPSQLSVLATSYDKLKQYPQAATIWLKLYQQQRKISLLKSALYALSKANNHDEMSQLLSSLLKQNSIALRYSAITGAFVDDFYAASDAYSLTQVRQLNQHLSMSKQIKSDYWVNANQCDDVINTDLSAQPAFAIMAVAQCKAETNKQQAITMVEAIEPKGIMEQLLLGSWYADINNSQQAITHWQSVPQSQLNDYQFHQYINSLLDLKLLQQAQSLWRQRSINSSQWQRIDGSRIFLGLGNATEAERLLTQAHDPFKKEPEAIALFHVYQQTQQTAKVTSVYNQIQARYGANNQLTQEYAFYLSRHQPQQAAYVMQRLFEQPNYQPNVFILTAYGDVLAKLDHNKQAKVRYQQAIDLLLEDKKPLTETDKKLQHYLQDSHRNVYQGWDFSVAGWVGQNASSRSSLITGQTGDYYQQLEAKYYFNETQWQLPRSALYINYGYSTNFTDSVSVGGDQQNYGKGFNDAVEVGLEWKPLKEYTVFIRGGLKSQKTMNDYQVNPYLTIRGDLLANDAWSKAWKYDQQQWWFQQLYAEGVANLANIDNLSFFGRYDLGRVVKVSDNHKQRIVPYGFMQYSYSSYDAEETLNIKTTDNDVRYGLGVLWLSEWMSNHYDGYKLISELGMEWQYVGQSSTAKEGDNAFLLRYALYY